MTLDLSNLTSDDFRSKINSKFRLHYDGPQELYLELVSVTDVGRDPEPGEMRIKRRPFSLIFIGSHQWQAHQGTHRLEHPEMGVLEIFLVPVGPNAQGMQYEAVFT